MPKLDSDFIKKLSDYYIKDINEKIAKWVPYSEELQMLIIDMVDTIQSQEDEIKDLRVASTCGCGICLAHNNMICPKLKKDGDTGG